MQTFPCQFLHNLQTETTGKIETNTQLIIALSTDHQAVKFNRILKWKNSLKGKCFISKQHRYLATFPHFPYKQTSFMIFVDDNMSYSRINLLRSYSAWTGHHSDKHTVT